MDYLTEKEIEVLILRFVRGRGEKGALEEEIHQVVLWGNTARLDAALLELTLEGSIGVDVQNGELFFGSLEGVQ